MNLPEQDIFCINVTWLRKHHNLTYRQMSNLIAISVRSLKRMERGVLPPTVDVASLYYIYKHFGIPPNQLFFTPMDE